MASLAWLVVAATAAADTCTLVPVTKKDPLDAGRGYSWADTYAGTWLQPTQRFVKFEPRRIGNIEGAVHAHLYNGGGFVPTPKLTRDFFDFGVEHFSYLTKMAPSKAGQAEFLGNITGRLRGFTRTRAVTNNFLPKSIGMVPFGGVPDNSNWRTLSSAMLRAVVSSMTQALARVVVTTCDEDHALLARAALEGLDRVVVQRLRLKACELPWLPRATQATLKRCLVQTTRDATCGRWLGSEDFKYVMYNDADLVLHARCISQLGKAMDADPSLIVLPHKLQTFAFDDAYTDGAGRRRRPDLGLAPSVRDLPQDVDAASCCDTAQYPALFHLKDGAFGSCRNFWYNCPDMLKLYDFARFDQGTYTPLLLGNEHGRRCALSLQRVACPAPTRRRLGGVGGSAPVPSTRLLLSGVEVDTNTSARRRLAAPRQYLVPLLAFGPNNQFEGLLEALAVAKLVGRTLLLPKYFEPHYRDTRSQKKRFEEVFDIEALRTFTDVQFVDDDILKAWKNSPKILASPLHKDRVVRALRNVGFDRAPRKKSYIRSHSRAADVAQAFKGFSAAGAVFVALAPLFVIDGEQPLLVEAARYRVRAPRIRALASHLKEALFPGNEKVLCAHVRRESETLGCVPGRRYVVCPTEAGTVSSEKLFSNIVDRAATVGAARVYLAHAGGRGFEGEPTTLLTKLTASGFVARSASVDMAAILAHVGDPFDVSLVEQELCASVEAFAPSARSTWSQTVVLDRSARGRRNAKFLDVGPGGGRGGGRATRRLCKNVEFEISGLVPSAQRCARGHRRGRRGQTAPNPRPTATRALAQFWLGLR